MTMNWDEDRKEWKRVEMKPVNQIVEPWKYYNYAILHTRGYNHVFDTMSYDRAFLARRLDLEAMLEATKDFNKYFEPKSILLCRYDWKGKTRPNWTRERLLSNQELEVVDDPNTLLKLNSNFIETSPRKPLKVRADLEITEHLPFILEVMYLNHAMPSSESDARKLEQAFYQADKKLTVSLTNFNSVERDWII